MSASNMPEMAPASISAAATLERRIICARTQPPGWGTINHAQSLPLAQLYPMLKVKHCTMALAPPAPTGTRMQDRLSQTTPGTPGLPTTALRPITWPGIFIRPVFTVGPVQSSFRDATGTDRRSLLEAPKAEQDSSRLRPGFPGLQAGLLTLD